MIYLDNASTTRQEQSSVEIANKFATEEFFNPSAIYATQNAQVIKQAKQVILQKLGLFSGHVVFTSSATEANNMILQSFGDQIVVSMGDHPSVFECAQALKNQGKNIEFCPLLPNGQINQDALMKLITPKTKLVSFIHVSNEHGAINDIASISSQIKAKNPSTMVHCDGVQAFLKIDVNLSQTQVDFYTISAHKIGGPKGIGALVARNKNKLKPLIFGGGQEDGLRSGTENLPAIAAFGHICQTRVPNREHVNNLKQAMIDIFEKEPNIIVNVPNGSPYVLSVVCMGINGETMVNALKEHGVFVSRGSACSSKKAGNRIFEAMGLNLNQVKSLIRISFFEHNTLEQAKCAANTIVQTYRDLIKRLN
jgi:cysteine desulfurase